MDVGEVIRVKISFKMVSPGLKVRVDLLGLKTISGKDFVEAQTNQATTTNPTLNFYVRATRFDVPTITVSSPDGRFATFDVVGQRPRPNDNSFLDENEPTTNPFLTILTIPLQEEAHKETTMDQPTRPQITPLNSRKKNWLHVLTGALTFFFIFFTGGWWYTKNTQTDEVEDAPLATPAIEPEEATAAEPEDPSEPEPEAEVVQTTPEPEAAPEVTPEPEPAAPVIAPPPQPPPASAAPATDPTNCTFVNGNRPQVGDKFVLHCDDGEYLATSEYKGGGVFFFSAFEPHASN